MKTETQMDVNEQRISRMRDYLRGCANGDEVITDLLFHCVGRVQLKTGEDLGSRLFNEALDRLSEVIHIADWLKVSVVEDAPWLRNVDNAGRPKKLLKFGSMAAITAEADRFMLRRSKASMPAEIKISEGDEESHFDLGDGWWLAKLLTPIALDRESHLMQHCIGQGGYDHRLSDEQVEFLSLRDPQGMPHATIEVDHGEVVQFQGKQNQAPIPKYVVRCLPYFQSKPFSHLPQSFVKDVSGTVYTVYDLPEVLRVDGQVHINNTVGNLRLPNVIEATGSVTLAGNACENVPARIKTGGRLVINGAVVDRLPEVLDVKEGISLSGSPISKLPDNLSLDGGLHLRGSAVKELPKGLTVRGCLDISRTAVTHLPEDLKCANIDISNTEIKRFDTSVFLFDQASETTRHLRACHSELEEIVGDPHFGRLDLEGSAITTLPTELRVDGELCVSKTSINSMSAGMVMGSLVANNCDLTIDVADIGGYVDLRNSRVSMPQTFTCGLAYLVGTTLRDVRTIKAKTIHFGDGQISVSLVADKVDFTTRGDTRIDANVVADIIEVRESVEFLGEGVSASHIRLGWGDCIPLADAREIISKHGDLRTASKSVGITTGPTGSGKSSIFAAALSSMYEHPRFGRNIITIEDPPEYFIPRIQVGRPRVAAG
jgi:hypothetical protein